MKRIVYIMLLWVASSTLALAQVPTAGKYFQQIVDTWQQSGKSDVETTKGHLVLARVLQACGLLETLDTYRDEEYEYRYNTGGIPYIPSMTSVGFPEGKEAHSPERRNQGFTIFAEGDDYWRSQGIDPASANLLPQLVQWIKTSKQYSLADTFTEGTDYASEGNLLHQWITYHMLPMRLTPDKLVIHDNELGYNSNQPRMYTIPVYEYYTTMGARRLLKIFESKESEGIYLNRFPILNNGRNEDGHEHSCDTDKVGCRVTTEAVDYESMCNCLVYFIDAPLSYNDATRTNLGSERLRFDVMSLFPEAMTNNIRRNTQGAGNERYRWVHIPESSTYQYFDNMWVSDKTTMVYYNTYENWCNNQEDELKAVGQFDVTIKLPPVPKSGMYELRMKNLANGRRGAVNFYFGTDPEDLPQLGTTRDMTISGKNSTSAAKIGWANDTEIEAIDAQTDLLMRAHGYMKGAKSISDRYNGSERDYGHHENLRNILGRQYMEAGKTYYLRIKSALDAYSAELYMDYFELCPECVYDNTETPEDIW